MIDTRPGETDRRGSATKGDNEALAGSEGTHEFYFISDTFYLTERGPQISSACCATERRALHDGGKLRASVRP